MRRAGNPRVWLSLGVFVFIVALLDYLLIDHLLSHGLEAKMQPVQLLGLTFSIPLMGLTFAGVLVVAIAAWGHIATTMPMTALREVSHLEVARMLRAAGLATFLFSIVLFGPYLMGTGGFWSAMASLARSMPLLAGTLQGFFSTVQPLMELEPMTKLTISQNAAAAALVAVSGLLGRIQIRPGRAK